MGTVYKLKPEIKAFILEKKKENPCLSSKRYTFIGTSLGLSCSASNLNLKPVNLAIKFMILSGYSLV